jgi:TPR repeat protein
MLRYHRFELALLGVALGAIALAVVRAGHYVQARGFFTEAARAGNVAGEIWLADAMANGLGAPPDGTGAVTWLTRAADAGSRNAARRLGELYRDGRVVLQDLDAARLWLTRAAKAGDHPAARELGALYAEGLGVRKDLVAAYQWLSLAASGGDELAASRRDRIAAQLSPDELRRGQDLAEARVAAMKAPPGDVTAAAAPPAPAG